MPETRRLRGSRPDIPCTHAVRTCTLSWLLPRLFQNWPRVISMVNPPATLKRWVDSSPAASCSAANAVRWWHTKLLQVWQGVLCNCAGARAVQAACCVQQAAFVL